MSLMNEIDGELVRDEMYQMARDRKGEKVTVSWIPEREEEIISFNPRVRTAIGFYRSSFSRHLAQHSVEATAISEMRTDVYVGENDRVLVRSYVLDDRGKEHIQMVLP